MKKLYYLKASVLYNANHIFTKDELNGLEITTDLRDFLYSGSGDINLLDTIESQYKELKKSLTEFYKSKMIVKGDQELNHLNYDRCKTIYNFCSDVYPIYRSTIDIPNKGRHLPDSFEEYMETYQMCDNIPPDALVNIEDTLCTALVHLTADLYKCIGKNRMGKNLIKPITSLDEFMELSYEPLREHLVYEVELYRESIDEDKAELYDENLLKCVICYIDVKGSELVEGHDIKLKIQKYEEDQPENLSSLLKEFIEDRWDDIRYTFNTMIKVSPEIYIKEINTLNELLLVISSVDMDDFRSLSDPKVKSNILPTLAIAIDGDKKSIVSVYRNSLRKIEENHYKIKYMLKKGFFKPVKK